MSKNFKVETYDVYDHKTGNVNRKVIITCKGKQILLVTKYVNNTNKNKEMADHIIEILNNSEFIL